MRKLNKEQIISTKKKLADICKGIECYAIHETHTRNGIFAGALFAVISVVINAFGGVGYPDVVALPILACVAGGTLGRGADCAHEFFLEYRADRLWKQLMEAEKKFGK